MKVMKASRGSTVGKGGRLLHCGVGGFRVLGTMIALCLSGPSLSAAPPDDLIRAAGKGLLSEVKRLIETGQLVNARDGYDRTAIWYACSKGHAEVVERLIDAGADFDTADRFGVRPLVAAVRWSRADALRVLLNAGARVNPEPRAKFIPLHVAVEQNDPAIVFLLLAAGADPLIQRVTGDPGTDLVRNQMIRARLRGMTLNAFLFLDTGSPVQLVFPVPRPQPGAVFEVRDDDESLVFRSVIPGPVSSPKLNVAWDRRDSTGLSVSPGYYTLALVFPDSTRNQSRRRALPYRTMTLFDAAAYGTPDVVAAWIRDGADVDGRDAFGRTPLMYAAAFGNRGTASALLSAGAVLDLTDGDGATAEDYGERYAPGQVLNFLLRKAKKRETITH